MDTYDFLIESLFPGISRKNYQVTSPETISYNCIAWAAGNDQLWFEPDVMSVYYWPKNIPRENSQDAFVALFGSFGYSLCDSDQLEEGYEKVAIYVDNNGQVTHASRQLKYGSWTSKIGGYKDISHNTLTDLAGKTYGYPIKFMKRSITK